MPDIMNTIQLGPTWGINDMRHTEEREVDNSYLK
jgi:hypothetical protein